MISVASYILFSAGYLWLFDGLLFITSILLAIFMFSYLAIYTARRKKFRQMDQMLQDVIAQIILCEGETELETELQNQEIKSVIAQYLSGSRIQRRLSRRLLKIRKGLSGAAVSNIVWLYKKLELYQAALQRIESPKWHIRAFAIQELAGMGQKQFLKRIWKATNDANFHVRMQAQLAMISLTGWEGLRFLNQVKYPVTPWEQLSILQTLPADAVPDLKKLRHWLQSDNETVVELALKLITKYQCFDLLPEVEACCHSASVAVHTEAVLILHQFNDTNFKEAV